MGNLSSTNIPFDNKEIKKIHDESVEELTVRISTLKKEIAKKEEEIKINKSKKYSQIKI